MLDLEEPEARGAEDPPTLVPEGPSAGPSPPLVGHSGRSSDEDSSSSSSSLSYTGTPAVPADDVIYVANLRAKMLHIEAGDGVLACGRQFPRSFSVLREMRNDLAACRRCFSSDRD